jgi:hypothetical protein
MKTDIAENNNLHFQKLPEGNLLNTALQPRNLFTYFLPLSKRTDNIFSKKICGRYINNI